MRVSVSIVKNYAVPNRVLRLAVLWLIIGVVPAFAVDVTIVPVFAGWREAASFKRISEYFSGKENTGGQLMLRTHPEQRAGYYFQFRINTAATVDTRLVLQVITPDTATPRTFNFTTSLLSPKTMLNLGLTAADWPDQKINPVAWKLEVFSADGKLIAAETSYLWERPATH